MSTETIKYAGHTPEPWRIADPHEYPWRLEDCGNYGERTVTIIGGDGYGVMSIPYSMTDGPLMANVHLWADAPALLRERDEARAEANRLREALDGYLNHHDRVCAVDGRRCECDMCIEARSALNLSGSAN